jgi:DNA-binding GntR family transcriptional regulator
LTASLRERLRPYRNTQFRSTGRLNRSHAEHDAIVRAIISGDPVKAHAAMLHHLGQASDAFQEALSSPLDDNAFRPAEWG